MCVLNMKGIAMPTIEAEISVENGWLTTRGRPVRGKTIITDRYGTPRNNWIGKHTGDDHAPTVPPDPDPNADDCIAIDEGWLEWVALAPQGPDGRNVNGGLGNLAQVAFPDGMRARYCHLREFAPRIQAWIDSGYDPAQRPWFTRDELVGLMGNVGFVYGAGGATPQVGDLLTGKHLHFEMLLADGTIVDPMDYTVDVPEVHIMTQTNPKPVAVVEPDPIDLSLVPAFNEARLLRTLIGYLRDAPILDEDGVASPVLALAVIWREATELVTAYGDTAGAALDEARALEGWAATLALNGGGGASYEAILDRAYEEADQIAHALRAQIPSAD